VIICMMRFFYFLLLTSILNLLQLTHFSQLVIPILSFRYKCHVCEHYDCRNDTTAHDNVCHDAIMCYKSSVRDSEGNERVTRGCTTKFEHLPLYCNQKDIQRGPKKREVSGLGTYNIECCEGDYCNSGPFPLLPPLPPIKEVFTTESLEDVVLKYCLAIFGPVVIIGVFTFIIVMIMRRNHKKRLMEARNSQDPDIYYANDDLLKRSHACGDSTLRVSDTNMNILNYS
jgi:activin receptor type-1